MLRIILDSDKKEYQEALMDTVKAKTRGVVSGLAGVATGAGYQAGKGVGQIMSYAKSINKKVTDLTNEIKKVQATNPEMANIPQINDLVGHLDYAAKVAVNLTKVPAIGVATNTLNQYKQIPQVQQQQSQNQNQSPAGYGSVGSEQQRIQPSQNIEVPAFQRKTANYPQQQTPPLQQAPTQAKKQKPFVPKYPMKMPK